jgi:hypothetical protein
MLQLVKLKKELEMEINTIEWHKNNLITSKHYEQRLAKELDRNIDRLLSVSYNNQLKDYQLKYSE